MFINYSHTSTATDANVYTQITIPLQPIPMFIDKLYFNGGPWLCQCQVSLVSVLLVILVDVTT